MLPTFSIELEITLDKVHASGPENSLRFEASDCSAQRDFKGQRGEATLSLKIP
jgi:hypothetical protein